MDSVRVVAGTVFYVEGFRERASIGYLKGSTAWPDVVVPGVVPLEDIIQTRPDLFALFPSRRRSYLPLEVSVERNVPKAAALDANVQVSSRQPTRMAP